MKKILAFLLVLSMLLTFTACSSGGTESKNREGSKSGTAYIDDCYIEITNCKAQISTATGQMILVVWVDFTNNSDEAKSLFHTASIKAYQNGKELSGSLSWIPEDHGIKDDDADSILPGYSISTGKAFPLDSTSDPVTIRILDGTMVISERAFNI